MKTVKNIVLNIDLEFTIRTQTIYDHLVSLLHCVLLEICHVTLMSHVACI